MNPAAESQPAVAALALAGAGAPKSVAVVHYGPDGARVATTGRATYAAGTAGGATVQYESKLAGGLPHGSSKVSVNERGRAVTAATRLLHPDGSVRKTVAADYSGVVLNAAGQPSTGAATFAVAAPDGTPTHRASLAFAGEQSNQYVVDQLGAGGSGVAGRTEVGFGSAKRVGTRLRGGELGVSFFKGGTTLTTQSRSVLTDVGLPGELHATNYGPDGKSTTLLVHSDYAGIAFDPFGRIDHGQLVITTRTPAGALLTTSLFRYAGGRQVSAKKSPPGTKAAPLEALLKKAIPGPWQPSRPADRTTPTTRPDGSLLEKREDWFAPGSAAPPRPSRARVTGYAPDGTTVVRVTDIDYAGATLDATGRPVGGTVVSTLYEAGIRSSTTQVTY
ncbi:MAG TPA: hypothetical protein VH092_19425 [Urbifossiella sp.]|jgi:hypothetical protein|nr:hypothetical protein [Urbifossiella sp.]